MSVVTEAGHTKIFAYRLLAVNQFILDFQKIVPLQKYFPETVIAWSEKSRFLSLNPPQFELGHDI
jgi:hypothetical protein